MPDTPSINRSGFSNARRSLAANEKKLVEAGANVVDLKADLTRLRATGATAAQIERIEDRLVRAQHEHVRLKDLVANNRSDLVELGDRLVINVDPASFLTTLDGRVPVAMLPVRLETRFIGNELRIRIFPDQIHINAHEPELLDEEAAAGRRYWELRWEAAANDDPDGAEAAWTGLTGEFDPMRALWIVEELTPTNIDQEGDPENPPLFPIPGHKSEVWARAAGATAMPNRWVAIGIKGGKRIFTQWGKTVPDWLPTMPTPDPTDDDQFDDIPADEPPGDEPMRWLVDYQAAVDVGMAITVPMTAAMQDGVEHLVVLGADWTLTPEAAAGRLDDLFRAHRYTEGFSFIPAGTATNNTGSGRSGHSEAAADLAASLDPSKRASPANNAAGPSLSYSLGLDRSTFNDVPGAHMTEAATAGAMHRVLWWATMGRYLEEMLDPQISKKDIFATLWHVDQFLRPGGPFSTIRVGSQPYGILPVVPHAGFRPNEEYEGRLHSMLGMLQGFWDTAAHFQPTMGRTKQHDQSLAQLLQRNPLAMHARWREVTPPEVANNSSTHAKLKEAQDKVWSMLYKHFGLGHKPIPKVSLAVNAKGDHPLSLPFTQNEIPDETSPLNPNYLAQILSTSQRVEGRHTLNIRSEFNTLLEVLVSHASVLETDRAAKNSLEAHYGIDEKVSEVLTHAIFHSDLYAVAPPSVVNLGQVSGSRTQVTVSTVEQQAHVVVPDLTGGANVADWVSTLEVTPHLELKYDLSGLKLFRDSLGYLATRPAAEIDRAFRGFLDASSHRLDAWMTSLATRRLHTVRSSRKSGVHLGGYGWVEDLKPRRKKPTSLGYIHAPSVPQATTAAILRSGNLSHANGAAFDIQMSSDRVQRAIPVLEGVAAGQNLGALLGYRIERNIRETNVRLARYILPLRRYAPLRGRDYDTPGAQEAIAARDVVDGVQLLKKWRASRTGVFTKIAAEPSHVDALTKLFDDLEVTYDAVADLLNAEAIFQTTLGNYERAGAALAAIDKQRRPPDLEVTTTHRTGVGYTQKVFAVMGGAVAPGWLSNDTRAKAAPYVNAWVSQLLPDPATVKFSGTLETASRTVELLEASVADLGMSPISLVMATAVGGADQPTELEARIARALTDDVLIGADDSLIVSDGPPASDPDAVGLGAFHALLDWIRELLGQSRTLEASDLVLPGGDRETGIDMASLSQPADLTESALSAALATITAVVDNPDSTVSQLRNALTGAAAFGIAAAVPAVGKGAGAPIRAALADLAGAVKFDLEKRLSAHESLGAEPGTADDDDTTPTERDLVEHHRARLITMLGGGFPVIPRFSIVETEDRAMLGLSLADTDSLTGSDPLLVRSWVDRMGLVRHNLGRLSKVLTAAEVLGAPGSGPSAMTVAQLPHALGQVWLALPFDHPPSDDTHAIVVHAPDGLNPNQPLAGIVCDEWSELVPGNEEMTGISFHFDAPGARAPQAILLATPPDLQTPGWSLDRLLDTVLEAARLARYRGVAPQDLPFNGVALPMLYLPNNFRRDRPSVDLAKLPDALTQANRSVLGKTWNQ